MAEETTTNLHRYALWLLPCGDTAHRLYRCIQQLSLRFHAPVFLPHLTLCSGIHPQYLNAVLAQCATIAGTTRPLQLAVTTFGTTNSFYRCLFLHVQESGELQHLYQRTKQWAGQPQLWLPHISLLYADIPHHTKVVLMDEFASYCYTVSECSTLALYNTTGTVEQWHKVAEWQLA